MDNSGIDEESIEGSEVSLFERSQIGVFTPLGKKKQFAGGHFDFNEDSTSNLELEKVNESDEE
jgi:hypothetical protein